MADQKQRTPFEHTAGGRDLPSLDHELDASGLPSPLPLLRAARALDKLQSGAVLRVVCTDEKSVADFQALGQVLTNCELIEQTAEDDKFIHTLRRL